MHRVLAIAEAANPEWVSVPLIGWSLTRALREVASVHLVTHVRNREALTRAGWVEGREFTALDSEAVAMPLYVVSNAVRGGAGKGWTTVQAISNLSYYYFEHLLWRRFGAQIRAGHFSVVHRITPLSPTTPSIIGPRLRRAGVPFVVGPINGGVPWPREFDRVRQAEREYLSYVRGAYRLMPGYASTRRSASALIVGSRATQELEPSTTRPRQVYLPENAIDPSRFPPPETKSFDLPLRVAFVGRLVPYKGADMLVEAARALVAEGKIEIDIYGDGPERSRLEGLIGDQHPRIRLHGWVPHAELHQRLSSAHILGFPSIREFGGGVVLEAMALGVVPVIVDYAGPAELVTPTTGFAVPLGSRDEIIRRFESVLDRLVAEPSQLSAMAERAHARIKRSFTWPVKARQIVEVYDWVTGRTPNKPDFGTPLTDAP